MTTYVVLDTNVWVYTTRLLSTALGASFLHSITRGGYRIWIPHVIEMELRKHVHKSLKEAIAEIDKGYRTIQIVMGSRDDYQVPSDEEIAARLDKRLAELEPIVERGDFTFEDAKNALARVLDATPPNWGKDQQFKDSAIWEAILRLASKSDVHFITEDKAFFNDRDPSKGLAHNLQADLAAMHGAVRVHSSLPDFLSILSEALPPIDYASIAERIAAEMSPRLDQFADERGYSRGPLCNHAIRAFLTEQPTVLAIEFHITFQGPSLALPSGAASAVSTQEVKGTCGYDLTSNTPEDILISDISVYDAHGARIPAYGQAFIYGVGNIFLGRKVIQHRLREPL
jgi:predicted nucleic acid-binding protein